MTRREQTLAIVVGSILAVALGSFGVRAFVLKPLQAIDKTTASLRDKLDKLKAEHRAYFVDEERMKAVAQRMFSEDLDQASARSGEMLTQQILQSGLHESDFTRLPVGPRKLKGASEIGWMVQGKGDLTRIVNLMFLLQTSPHLHRIEG